MRLLIEELLFAFAADNIFKSQKKKKIIISKFHNTTSFHGIHTDIMCAFSSRSLVHSSYVPIKDSPSSGAYFTGLLIDKIIILLVNSIAYENHLCNRIKKFVTSENEYHKQK